MFVQEPDGGRRDLDARTLVELRRIYWQRFRSYEEILRENEQERERRETSASNTRCDEYFDAVQEGWRKTGLTLFGGQPRQVFTGE
jgi:hypothetical protein